MCYNKHIAQEIKEGEGMKNIEMTVNGDILTVRIDLSQRHGKSASGKNEIIASTEGNQSIPEHDAVRIGLNVYTKA